VLLECCAFFAGLPHAARDRGTSQMGPLVLLLTWDFLQKEFFE
jgi:hypothetical protein